MESAEFILIYKLYTAYIWNMEHGTWKVKLGREETRHSVLCVHQMIVKAKRRTLSLFVNFKRFIKVKGRIIFNVVCVGFLYGVIE